MKDCLAVLILWTMAVIPALATEKLMTVVA